MQDEVTQQRLTQLLSVIQNVASGDFNVRAEKQQDDILGMLAVGINMMIDDIAEMIAKEKVLSEELKKKRDELEATVTERTQELSEAVDKLQRSNRDLEMFAYAASHDLQEPLRMISNYLQLLQRRYGERLDRDGHEFLEFAVDGAIRMTAMIKDLLSYSRVDSQGEAFAETNANDAVSSALANLHAVIDETQCKVVVDTLPTIQADKSQLAQLFQNLISNAIKYRGDTEPLIRVSAKSESGMCCFSIQDNGLGIDEKYHERIFQVFQRLHGKGTRSGTGIGLALCKRIVERHGGSIWVTSELGQGSTFYFTIPDEASLQVTAS
jgi:light-regulated signal transduction histidine kinase (bacteriophytochrome)